MNELKICKGIIDKKEAPRTFPKKSGEGMVTIYNFWISGNKYTHFSDTIDEQIEEGKYIEFEYKEEVKGIYTNRTFERFYVKGANEVLSKTLLDRIEKVGEIMERTGEDGLGPNFRKEFDKLIDSEPKHEKMDLKVPKEKEKIEYMLPLNGKKYKLTIEEI